jgi:hypothetical protein
MKTIAQQLNIKDFPFTIKDKNGNTIYFETSDKLWSKTEYDSNGNQIYYEGSNGYWEKKEFDSNGRAVYFEDSNGYIIDDRPKSTCEGKVIEIDGKKYELKEIK